MKSEIQRFLENVDIKKPEECWPYIGKSRNGLYGAAYFGGRTQGAHRVSYEIFVGKIKKPLTIDHLCRNPICVNPNHLEMVTSAENTMRGDSPPARNALKTHCPYGHPYDGENTYKMKNKKNGRMCKECIKISTKKLMAKRKEARRINPKLRIYENGERCYFCKRYLGEHGVKSEKTGYTYCPKCTERFKTVSILQSNLKEK